MYNVNDLDNPRIRPQGGKPRCRADWGISRSEARVAGSGGLWADWSLEIHFLIEDAIAGETEAWSEGQEPKSTFLPQGHQGLFP